MLASLQFTVYLAAVLVVCPTTPGPTWPQVAKEVLSYGEVDGAMLPPALFDGLFEDDAAIGCLRRLEHLYFARAPLAWKCARKLLSNVMLKPSMGSTEAGV
jgi:hypothetical protein